jgi:hypothetical protein
MLKTFLDENDNSLGICTRKRKLTTTETTATVAPSLKDENIKNSIKDDIFYQYKTIQRCNGPISPSSSSSSDAEEAFSKFKAKSGQISSKKLLPNWVPLNPGATGTAKKQKQANSKKQKQKQCQISFRAQNQIRISHGLAPLKKNKGKSWRENVGLRKKGPTTFTKRSK